FSRILRRPIQNRVSDWVRMMNLGEIATEISRRLARIFLRDEQGGRPVFGDAQKFRLDKNWRDLIPFHEYFDGDTGAGLGASHQTGWTALVANLLLLQDN